MSSRGVLYMVWDQDDSTPYVEQGPLSRSLAAIRAVHPGLPVEIARLPVGSGLLDKASMYERSPFETTLFLDADTVVLGDLTYGFEKSEQFGIACSICECPWANRYPSIEGDLIEYNTGVLFFAKDDDVQAVFDAWRYHNDNLDSSIEFKKQTGEPAKMEENDQAGFAMAVHDLGFNPFVLPQNWNFRPIWQKTWFGPIKVWHDYGQPPKDVANRGSMEFFNLAR